MGYRERFYVARIIVISAESVNTVLKVITRDTQISAVPVFSEQDLQRIVCGIPVYVDLIYSVHF